MVAMHVGDEDGIELGEMNMGATELHLCSFSAIHHKALASHLYELRGGVMLKGGQRTATPQNMYLKWFQNFYSNLIIIYNLQFIIYNRLEITCFLLLAFEDVDALRILQRQTIRTQIVDGEGILVKQELSVQNLP